MVSTSASEAARLERLWAGEFGDAYMERNAQAGERRGDFWFHIAGLLGIDTETALEIGCNIGANLQHLRRYYDCVGLDVNAGALAELRRRCPTTLAVEGPARSLPFPNASFDLVFTCGVLIHQSEEALSDVIREMVRVSRRWVLAIEYWAYERTEVPYRDQSGALFKDDYPRRFLEQFPDLRLAEMGFLGRECGFDDMTWALFEKCA